MKKRILTVIGARPQIIKAAAFSRVVRNQFHDSMEEIILHTGQHYDKNMSQIFFDELGIPAANYNLNVGSGSHAQQSAAMMTGIEDIILKEKPDALLVYGDTNSTLAGALTAVKLHLPVVHVEAGLRSFDKSMPEEVNRILTDHVSALLFAPTDTAIRNLENEGFDLQNTTTASTNKPLVVKSGDVMYDNALYYQRLISDQETSQSPFMLVTIHRDHNTDHPDRLRRIIDAVGAVAAKHQLRVILPLHPRTRIRISAEELNGWKMPAMIEIIEPVSYLEMISLESRCTLVVTDSGGVQKEAFFFKKPCIILRPHTEWTEIVACGSAAIASDDADKIMAAADHFMGNFECTWPEIFGDGHSAEHMAKTILHYF